MIATLLLALATPLSPTAPADWGSWFSGDSPIEIWASKTHGLRHGERVRLYARSERDGYLVVLHAEPSGRVRVLFPLDPLEDNYMRGGTSYELRGRGGREAFEIFDRSGYGMVLAAFSRDPFRFDALMRGDHWDYTQLELWRVSGDPEGHLLDLVDRMAMGRYDYDILRYDVVEYVAYRSRPLRLSLYGAYWDDHHHSGLHLSLYLGHPWFYYRPYYSPALFYPIPVHYYPPYFYVPPLFVGHWYDPFFDPYFPYYWYRPAYYVIYYPRYYHYAYYSAYYPAYRSRSVPVRYAGGYTFKLGSQPSVIEPRRRAVLAEAVARRLVSPDNFSTPAGSSIRRAVASEPAVSRPVAQPAGAAGRRVVGSSTPERAQPASVAGAEPRRRTVVTERAPAVGGEAPRRAVDRELDRRRSLGDEARRPVAAPSNDRSLEQIDWLRRVVPHARERVEQPSRSASPAPPGRGGLDAIGGRGRGVTDAIPESQSERELPGRRGMRYNSAAPGPAAGETRGAEELVRRSAPVIREPEARLEPAEYRQPARAISGRAEDPSFRIVPRRDSRVVEPRAFQPAVAAPLRVAPRRLVPQAQGRPQGAEPSRASGRRKP